MKVRLKLGWTQSYHELTAGNRYRVIGIENDKFRIMDDAGVPVLFNPIAFDIVDDERPSDWNTRSVDGAGYAYPVALDHRGFFEKWFDGDVSVRRKLSSYLTHLCYQERVSIPPPPNLFMRTRSVVQEETEPVVAFVEVDNDGLEVRRVEVFNRSIYGYACARGSFGSTILRTYVGSRLNHDRDTIPDDEVITRSEFEEAWDQALSFEETEQEFPSQIRKDRPGVD